MCIRDRGEAIEAAYTDSELSEDRKPQHIQQSFALFASLGWFVPVSYTHLVGTYQLVEELALAAEDACDDGGLACGVLRRRARRLHPSLLVHRHQAVSRPSAKVLIKLQTSWKAQRLQQEE